MCVPPAFFPLPQEVRNLSKKLSISKICFAEIDGEAEVDLSTRTIYLREQDRKNRDEAIANLVFEMCNLASRDQFEALKLKVRRLSVYQFVESWERIEYQNIRKALEILEQIEVSSSLEDLASGRFEYYYLVQQVMGHADEVARKYNTLTGKVVRFMGTWHLGIRNDQQRKLLRIALCRLSASSSTKRESLVQDYKGQEDTWVYQQLTQTQAVLDQFPSIKNV